MAYKDYKHYKHIKCPKCGEIPQVRRLGDYKCSIHGTFWDGKYDYVAINDKTAWVFPMLKRQ